MTAKSIFIKKYSPEINEKENSFLLRIYWATAKGKSGFDVQAEQNELGFQIRFPYFLAMLEQLGNEGFIPPRAHHILRHFCLMDKPLPTTT